MKKIWKAFFIFIIINPLAFSKKNVKYASDPWPPYISFENENNSHGIMIDILELVFPKKGYNLSFEELPWKRVLANLKRGLVDIAGPMLKNKERESYLVFSDIILKNNIVVWTRKMEGKPVVRWEKIEDLGKFVIGGVIGYSYGPNIDKLVSERVIKLERVTDSKQNFKKLATGRIDGFLSAEIPDQVLFKKIQGNLKDSNSITMISQPVYSSGYHIGISKKSLIANDLKEINQRIRDLNSKGKMKVILNSYK